jgi:hypothetical protein
MMNVVFSITILSVTLCYCYGKRQYVKHCHSAILSFNMLNVVMLSVTASIGEVIIDFKE